MGLQSATLAMTVLPVVDDRPAVDIQPRLPDGVHLRWATRTFPWYGFHLFRRPHEERGEQCLDADDRSITTSAGAVRVITPLGVLHSDVPLVLTGRRPLELWPRRSLTLDLAAPAHRLRVTLTHTDQVETAVRLSAADGLVTVDRAAILLAPGETAVATLRADRITALEVEGGVPVVVDRVCAASVDAWRRGDWAPLPDAPQPLALPVTDPDHPARPGPPDRAIDEAEALSRVRYGDPAAWAGDRFGGLHDRLRALVVGGPGVPMDDPARAETEVVGIPGPGTASGAAAPVAPSVHPLDLVQLASVDAAVAEIVGLAWVDRTVHPDATYDYLVVADHTGAGGGDPQQVLGALATPDLAGMDGWIVFDVRPGTAPPLAAPTGVRAHALPVSSARRADVDLVVPAGAVGLTWTDVRERGLLPDGAAVAHHVWREDQGDADAPVPTGGPATLVTASGPVLVTAPAVAPTRTPQSPADWPPFRLHAIDPDLPRGWYAYRVSAVDLFGRISAPGAEAPWFQWGPEPTPRPWYYVDPPGPAEIHPTSVRLLGGERPPAPTAVVGSALDPDDPLVVRDAAHEAWRGGAADVVGVRVGWRWTASQVRQAPGVVEFRVYWRPEPGLVGQTEPAGWPVRAAVVAMAQGVLDDAGHRTFDVFLPVTAGEGPLATGLDLTPGITTPVALGQVSVSAADDAPQIADTWPGGSRPGAESRVAAPATVAVVWREPPPPPGVVVDSEIVSATPADWHGRSLHTVRWTPTPGVAVHVLRAVDAAVLAADRAAGPRPRLDPGDLALFPPEAEEPTWNEAKRTHVCDELASFPDDGSAALSDDALRVLAGLPRCAVAFVQRTTRPHAPDDSACADRRGPDDPDGYIPSVGRRAVVDDLDGRARNRYLYRTVGVDAAGNRGTPSRVHVPVRLPDVTAPRVPVVSEVVGGDRQVELAWSAVAGASAYRVFRGADADEARRATRTGPPAAELVGVQRWTDEPVPAGMTFWYVVVAVRGELTSGPSAPAAGRAFDLSVPDPPTWEELSADAGGTVRLSWSGVADADEVLVERRTPTDLVWIGVSTGLRGVSTYDDVAVGETAAVRYRLRVRRPTGAATVGPVGVVEGP